MGVNEPQKEGLLCNRPLVQERDDLLSIASNYYRARPAKKRAKAMNDQEAKSLKDWSTERLVDESRKPRCDWESVRSELLDRLRRLAPASASDAPLLSQVQARNRGFVDAIRTHSGLLAEVVGFLERQRHRELAERVRAYALVLDDAVCKES